MGGTSPVEAGRATTRLTPFSINGNSISIEVLTGLNFKKWKEDFLFGMELADVHIALTKDKP